MKRKTIFRSIFTLVTFSGIMLLLWLKYPQYLLYQEQYQLFLFTWNYFAGSIAEPGGLANYLSEFIVQFYYVPLYGAILTALTLTLSQVFLGLSCRRCSFSESAYVFSSIPAVLYLGAMGDENILLSYTVAMMLTTLFLFLFTFLKNPNAVTTTLTIITGFAILYWNAGPFAITFIIAAGILSRRYLSAAISIAAGFLIVWGIHTLWFEQYPISRMLQGINYYRVPEIYPVRLYVIAAMTALLPAISLIKNVSYKKATENVATCISVVIAVVFAMLYVPASFDKDKSKVLTYDSLVRQGRWNDIIAKATEEMPSDNFSLQALNLALGMKGELTETMFRYNQKGIESLIGRDRLDNTSHLITAEALFRLGLTNIAFSTTFDLQEAIMNDRKSGRLMKRMAECMIINGNYDVAAKYLGILRNSLYYADWAQRAEKLLYNDPAVEAHPIYGPLRGNSFKEVAFYDYTQIDKILAMLAMGSKGANQLAWEYFCASAMLKGDLPTLAGVYSHSSGEFNQQRIPRHVQEAIAMYWTFSHETFEGIPFPLSREVRQQTAALAQAVTRNPDNPRAWREVAPGSYSIYFLSNSLAGNKPESPVDYQHTHE